MNESMLNSLMRLFAIMVSINRGALHILARNFVESFLIQQFSRNLADKYLEIFEEHGCRHGLTIEEGYILGTEAPSLADLVAHILWGVMTSKLPPLRSLLDTNAPAIASLSNRIAQLPEQVELRVRSDAAYGDEWCSGQIEASLRAVT